MSRGFYSFVPQSWRDILPDDVSEGFGFSSVVFDPFVVGHTHTHEPTTVTEIPASSLFMVRVTVSLGLTSLTVMSNEFASESINCHTLFAPDSFLSIIEFIFFEAFLANRRNSLSRRLIASCRLFGGFGFLLLKKVPGGVIRSKRHLKLRPLVTFLAHAHATRKDVDMAIAESAVVEQFSSPPVNPSFPRYVPFAHKCLYLFFHRLYFLAIGSTLSSS